MERRAAALFVAILFSGCLGIQLPFLGGEPNLVPSKADFVLHLRIGDIVSDPDILRILNKSGSEFEAELRRSEAETGIDARKVSKLIIFGNMNRLGPAPYTGAIAFGQIDQQTFITKAEASKGARKETYAGYAIYTEGPGIGDNAFTFIDGALVSGTREAVQDVIDVKSGAAKPLDNERMNEAANKVDKNAKAFFSAYLQGGVGAPTAPIPGAQGLQSAQAVALALDKQGSSVTLKAAILANDSVSANRLFNSINGVLSLGKAFVEPGSAGERLLGQARIEAQGNFVLVGLATTVSDLEAFGEEMSRQRARQPPLPPVPAG